MNLVRELGRFLMCHKLYWLVPWIAILALLAALLAVGGGTAAPFIYEPF